MNKTVKLESVKQTEVDRKNIVTEYFKLAASGKFKDGLKFFAPDCKTHNPFISGGMAALTDAMIAAANLSSPVVASK